MKEIKTIVPDRKTGNILISSVEPKTDSMENARLRQKNEIARKNDC